MDAQTPWHRLFGGSWVDFFQGLPVTVEQEKDLSLKQQWLDLVLVRKEAAELPRRLPDGFDDLAAHNLITFKSYQEALDGWALNELIAHYVNYRKQISPSFRELLPERDFHLYAVCVRSPQGLAEQVPLRQLQSGVYEVRHFTGVLRVIVVHELPREEHNAMLHLFSAREDLVRYGAAHYRPRSPESSTLLYQLFERYRLEGVLMPDALEQLYQETIEAILQDRKTLDAILLHREAIEAILQDRRTLDAILQKTAPEERLKGLSVDELLTALPPEVREELARRLRENGSPASSGGQA